jgi:hypothetical protein
MPAMAPTVAAFNLGSVIRRPSLEGAEWLTFGLVEGVDVESCA